MATEKGHGDILEPIAESEAIKRVLKSNIPIIQAQRDKNYSFDAQKTKVELREQQMKEERQGIIQAIESLSALGIDVAAAKIKFGYQITAFTHAFSGVEHSMILGELPLSEYPALVAERQQYLRDHSLSPYDNTCFTCFGLELAPPIAEIQEEIFLAKAASKTEVEAWLQKFFETLKPFLSPTERGPDNLYLFRFFWQMFMESDQTKEIFSRFFDFDGIYSPLQDFSKNFHYLSDETKILINVLNVEFNVGDHSEPKIEDSVAESDYYFFRDAFEKEMGGDRHLNDAAYEAMEPADARMYIKKFFAECFKFYPELDEKLSNLLPDTEPEPSKKIPEILKKLFEGLIF